jgi:multimeric flavodoxin WrbA
MENHMNSVMVLALHGSPRKNGNSSLLATHISMGAESVGAIVEDVFLHEMEISPCSSCQSCRKPDSSGCAIDDEMQAVYQKLIKANGWIIASPVYWFNMSAQSKIFINRCYGLRAYTQNPYAGKRIAIAMSYGGSDPFSSGCINALRSFQDIYRYVGAEIVGMVYGSAMDAGEIKSNKGLLQKAETLGKKLAGAAEK